MSASTATGEMVIAIAVVCVALAAGILWLVRSLIRKSGLVHDTRLRAANMQGEMAATKDVAERIISVTQSALGQTGAALDAAQEIHNVSSKVDEVIDHLGRELPTSPCGRHARRELHILPRKEGDVA